MLSNSLYSFPYVEDPQFSEIVRSVELAIEHGIYPERIYQGSSGSYFAKDAEEVRFSSFCSKVRNPFGHLPSSSLDRVKRSLMNKDEGREGNH